MNGVWTDITKELPPVGEYVLILKPEWLGEPCAVVTKRRDTGYERPAEDWEGYYGPEPTHWMRIPRLEKRSLTHEPSDGLLKSHQDTIGVLARRVVSMGNPLRDHACPQCMPEGGDLVNIDFVCAYHLASYLVKCREYQMPQANELKSGVQLERVESGPPELAYRTDVKSNLNPHVCQICGDDTHDEGMHADAQRTNEQL